MPTEQELREIKRRHSARLLAIPGVCGVGVERSDPSNWVIAVHFDVAKPGVAAAVPDALEGIAIRKIPSQPFHAH